MARKIKEIKAETYDESIEVENEIKDEVEEESAYDIDFEDFDEEESNKKEKRKKL